MQNIHTILEGDLNLYMKPSLDKADNSPDHNDNWNFKADVCSLMETNNSRQKMFHMASCQKEIQAW